jgi:hypothetical protein
VGVEADQQVEFTGHGFLECRADPGHRRANGYQVPCAGQVFILVEQRLLAGIDDRAVKTAVIEKVRQHPFAAADIGGFAWFEIIDDPFMQKKKPEFLHFPQFCDSRVAHNKPMADQLFPFL